MNNRMAVRILKLDAERLDRHQIERAFRTQSLLCHPDRAEGTTRKFIQLLAAKEFLLKEQTVLYT